MFLIKYLEYVVDVLYNKWKWEKLVLSAPSSFIHVSSQTNISISLFGKAKVNFLNFCIYWIYYLFIKFRNLLDGPLVWIFECSLMDWQPARGVFLPNSAFVTTGVDAVVTLRNIPKILPCWDLSTGTKQVPTALNVPVNNQDYFSIS